MTFQASSLRKYGLSLAFLLLIVLAAVLSLFALSTQHTPAHADGLFVLNVDKSQSGNGKVFLSSNINPSAEMQISVDDQVVATFPSGTTSGSIDIQPGLHEIIGRYAELSGHVIESVITFINVDPNGNISDTYQSSVSQPDSSAISSSSIDVQPTDVSVSDQ